VPPKTIGTDRSLNQIERAEYDYRRSAARCSKSVTKNRDNWTNNFRAHETRAAAGVTRFFRSRK